MRTDQAARNAARIWDDNPQVAQIYPQNVEKMPFFHWRYGARLLCVGSRDGAAYDEDIAAAEANTFHRPLTTELLTLSHEKLGTEGICVAQSASLWYPNILAIADDVARTAGVPLVVACPGYGDAALLETYLPLVDAWIIMIDDAPGPLCARIMEAGKHVEVLWGLPAEVASITCADLPWSAVSAIHLRPRRAAQGVDNLAELYDRARSLLPESCLSTIYDDVMEHSHCSCGETLVWRQGGRSRLDTLDAVKNCCRSCGAAVAWAASAP